MILGLPRPLPITNACASKEPNSRMPKRVVMLGLFARILIEVILPVFLLIGLGALLDRRFRLDLPTLAKLNFYAFVPALSFVALVQARIDARQMLRVGGFTLVHLGLMFGLMLALCLLVPALRRRLAVLTLGATLNNCGNYGIPLVLLAFPNLQQEAVGVLIVIIVLQNLFIFTIGIWLMERQARRGESPWLNMLKIPVIYAIAAALLVRAFGWTLPAPLMTPLQHLYNGLIAVALLTLGVQLSRARPGGSVGPVALITGMRLVVAPLLAAALLPCFHLPGWTAAILIVAAGFPVAVNLTILSAEYQHDEDLASQSIFISTLLSAVTLSVILALVR